MLYSACSAAEARLTVIAEGHAKAARESSDGNGPAAQEYAADKIALDKVRKALQQVLNFEFPAEKPAATQLVVGPRDPAKMPPLPLSSSTDDQVSESMRPRKE